jgi:type VI secretion system secreted protein Hcp
MRGLDHLLLAVVALALLPVGVRAQTSEFYVQIEGTKQGQFANESARNNHAPRVVGLNFDYTVKVPRDASTGLTSGRRQHSPVILTKEWGAASPQLFQALVTNEVLRVVLFEFYRTNQNGEEELATTVKLTNATVVEIHQHSPTVAKVGQLEDISFTFGGIEIQNQQGKTMAADSWTTLR